MRSLNRTLTVLGLSALMLGAAEAVMAQAGTGSTPTAPPSRPARPDRPERPARPDRPERGAPEAVKVGQPAPAFTLPDTKGVSHSLSDYKGKIVVLQWINPECPVCQRVMKDGVTSRAQKDATAAGGDVVWLFVNSTFGMTPDTTAKYLEQNKSDTVALIDASGTVGRSYNARTTPHIFVIDEEGILRYEGAIDDDPSGNKAKSGDAVTTYPVAAIKQIKAGETVSPDSTRPYGCSVKYEKRGDGPRDRGTPPPDRGRDRGGRQGGAGSGAGTGAGGDKTR